MSNLIDWLQQPVGFIGFFLVIALLVGAWQNRWWCLSTLTLLGVTVMYWLLGTPALANQLVWQLETQRQASAACISARERWPFVVLGGGFDHYSPSSDPLDILHRNSLQRLYRVLKVAPETATIYVLGGGTQKYKLGDLMAEVLINFGVDNERIVRERGSRSTYENAVALSQLWPADQPRSIQLVTTAMHMPRAAATFEKQGFEVCEVLADRRYSPPALPASAFPYLTALSKSSYALHEYVGWWAYQVRGKL